MSAWDELAERFHELFGERVSGAELRRRHIEEGKHMTESTDPVAGGPQGGSQGLTTPSVPPSPAQVEAPAPAPESMLSAWPEPGWYGGRYWTGASWQDDTAPSGPAATPAPVPGFEGPQLPYSTANPEQDTAPEAVADTPDPGFQGPGLGAGVVATVGGSPAAGILVGEPDENGDASVLVYQRGVGFHEYALTFDTTQGDESPDGTYRGVR